MVTKQFQHKFDVRTTEAKEIAWLPKQETERNGLVTKSTKTPHGIACQTDTKLRLIKIIASLPRLEKG